MGNIYRLSPQIVEQLTTIETKVWPIYVIYLIVMLVLHFAMSVALYLIGYFQTGVFFVITLFLVGLLLYYFYRNPAYIRRFYFSYEIELSDQSIIYRQNSKPLIEIRSEEITQILELLPEGEIYIKGKKNRLIDVYALLLRENSDIKAQLAKWQHIDTSSISIQKLSQPITTILLAFLAVGILIDSFSNPNLVVVGLTALGYSIISFFALKPWPVRDPRLKKLLWIVPISAFLSVPLGILSLLWSVYIIVGMYLGTS
jgi:hypothetical protein